MILGIDGNEANVNNRVGSNVYSYKLLEYLYKADKFNTTIYLSSPKLGDLPKKNSNWNYKVLKPGFLWTQWRLPLELYFNSVKPDVFFTPGHYSPRFCPCPSVISIMDLAYLRYPDQFKKKDLWQLTNWTKYSVDNAALIFTISEFTKKEIIHFYNYPKDQITVTYPGVENLPNFHKANKYGDYFLYIGTLQPRKNLIRLIEAFKSINAKLVVVGKKGWLYENIFNKVKSLGCEKNVIFTGFISESEKTALIVNAKALILASLYEGFGIPVVEAMRLKCPVIVSQNSSLEEVVAKNGIYIEDPLQVDSIVASIRQMLQLSKEKKALMVNNAYKESLRFNWQECAKKTQEALWLLKTKPAKT